MITGKWVPVVAVAAAAGYEGPQQGLHPPEQLPHLRSLRRPVFHITARRAAPARKTTPPTTPPAMAPGLSPESFPESCQSDTASVGHGDADKQ